MKFAPVMPPELYPTYSRGDYHLVQAHTIVNNRRVQEWAEDHAHKGNVVILDNGVIELGKPDMDTLFAVARKIRPTVIICPDVFCNAELTLLNFSNYAYECLRYSKQIMAVPHGNDIASWMKCAIAIRYRAMKYNISHKLVIGIPKVLDSYEKHGRYKAIESLVDTMWLQERIHLLGVWSGIDQLFRIRNDFPDIMGVDTTLPVALALNHEKMLGAHAPKRKITSDQWKMTLDQVDPAMNDALKHNIELVGQIVSEPRMEDRNA